MNKQDILDKINSGEVTIETIVDSYLLEKQRSEAVYPLMTRLEKFISSAEASSLRIEQVSNDDQRVMNFLKHFIVTKEGWWEVVIEYIIDQLEQKNESKYIEISDLYGIISPTDSDDFIRRRYESHTDHCRKFKARKVQRRNHRSSFNSRACR